MQVSGSENPKSADLDRFLSEPNIARYRVLLDPDTDERRRRTILGLLEREFAALKTTKSPSSQQGRRPR